MSWNEYFLLTENWSLAWAVVLLGLFAVYAYYSRPTARTWTVTLAGIVLLYIATGSPLAHLLKYDLHSIAMMQHVLILMVVPLLFWMGDVHLIWPFGKRILNIKNKTGFILTAWLTGTSTMWAAHFLSAVKISAESGLVICGISAPAGSWVAGIPQWLMAGLLFVAGMIFLWPVFTRVRGLRLRPFTAVIYLFTACVSCTILGLYVAFSASAAAPVIAHPESPLLMTLRSDQELAGLLMWVPGCVLYVLTSVHIAIRWLEGNEDPITSKTWPLTTTEVYTKVSTGNSKTPKTIPQNLNYGK